MSFDPRPREGATRGRGVLDLCQLGGFDPRPREGATVTGQGAVSLYGVSIRAPVRGRPATL